VDRFLGVVGGVSSDQIKAAVEAGHPRVGELAKLRGVSYVDLPTGHWPMWSRTGAGRDPRRRGAAVSQRIATM
jgi:hypothetical protein